MSWSDADDAVFGSDLVAAVAYSTPAGGCVVTAVAPIGLRDRRAGTVAFTTSLGFGKKLERMRRDPRVAVAYHCRKHGLGPAHDDDRFLLVQGIAEFAPQLPSFEELERLGKQVAPFLGPPRRGWFWDRWLEAYYRDRIVVTVHVERIVDLPEGPLPDAAPAQSSPKGGTGPRVDVARSAKRARRLPYRLLAWRGADGFPVVVPVEVDDVVAGGMPLSGPVALPTGGRRAGFLAHDFRAKMVGLEARQHTGWLQDGIYAPHTAAGFVAPPNKTLLLLANGYLARRGLKRALREQKATA